MGTKPNLQMMQKLVLQKPATKCVDSCTTENGMATITSRHPPVSMTPATLSSSSTLVTVERLLGRMGAGVPHHEIATTFRWTSLINTWREFEFVRTSLRHRTPKSLPKIHFAKPLVCEYAYKYQLLQLYLETYWKPSARFFTAQCKLESWSTYNII